MDIMFSASARATLDRAQDASRTRNQEYVGQEHILLAILGHGTDERCAAVVRVLGIDTVRMESTIDGVIKKGREPVNSLAERPYTSRAHKSLELALKAAGELGRVEAGPEHLVVGMCDEGKGIGAQVLADAGVDANKARDAAQAIGQ
jgi:ATP-dependent Clp protease ATP-binding subunit ClpC